MVITPPRRILAAEAFRAAADPKRFPEQLKYVQPWQPRRLLWNSWAAFRAQQRKEPIDVTGLIRARSRRLSAAPREIVSRDRRRQPQHAQKPGFRGRDRARRTKGIFQISRRRADQGRRRHFRMASTRPGRACPEGGGGEREDPQNSQTASMRRSRPLRSPRCSRCGRLCAISVRTPGSRRSWPNSIASSRPASVCISKRSRKNRWRSRAKTWRSRSRRSIARRSQ